MAAFGVRRAKAALSSGCKPHPAIAPAGSNRSGAHPIGDRRAATSHRRNSPTKLSIETLAINFLSRLGMSRQRNGESPAFLVERWIVISELIILAVAFHIMLRDRKRGVTEGFGFALERHQS